MKSYHVIWEIDVNADSSKGAAEQALAACRDPASLATVFDVTEENSSVTERVDLG